MENEPHSPKGNNAWIAVVIVAIVLIGLVYFVGAANQTPTTPSTAVASNIASTTTPTVATDQVTTTTSPVYSQHASDYIYSYLLALSYLYASTQSYSQMQALFGSQSDVITPMLASLDEVISDLKTASSGLQPYINDDNQVISATSKLLYADILTELNDATQMQSSLTYAYQNQDATALRQTETEAASFAADKNTLETDLQQGMSVIKYVIETPPANSPATGNIDYVISPDNRAFLVQQIGTLFPVQLNPTTDQTSIYLLDAHVISITLSAGTYEQAKIDASQL